VENFANAITFLVKEEMGSSAPETESVYAENASALTDGRASHVDVDQARILALQKVTSYLMVYLHCSWPDDPISK